MLLFIAKLRKDFYKTVIKMHIISHVHREKKYLEKMKNIRLVLIKYLLDSKFFGFNKINNYLKNKDFKTNDVYVCVKLCISVQVRILLLVPTENKHLLFFRYSSSQCNAR